MENLVISVRSSGKLCSFVLSALVLGFLVGCSSSHQKASADTSVVKDGTTLNEPDPAEAPRRAVIEIDPNGPADTVRAFYRHLREKKFREAIFLTNLRPAIEGLTESELNDFSLDFEELAGQVPAEVEINGEIITGDQATVTANLPGREEKNEIQSLKLRRTGDVWVIQTVDESASDRIRKEGKQYFFNLRIETHEEEARRMLERISKAQLAHSLQNNGLFADIGTLVSSGLLPDDVRTSRSTGYEYAVDLASDRKAYFASATPAVYGKSGRLSFFLKLDGKGIGRVSSKDVAGRSLKP